MRACPQTRTCRTATVPAETGIGCMPASPHHVNTQLARVFGRKQRLYMLKRQSRLGLGSGVHLVCACDAAAEDTEACHGALDATGRSAGRGNMHRNTLPQSAHSAARPPAETSHCAAGSNDDTKSGSTPAPMSTSDISIRRETTPAMPQHTQRQQGHTPLMPPTMPPSTSGELRARWIQSQKL